MLASLRSVRKVMCTVFYCYLGSDQEERAKAYDVRRVVIGSSCAASILEQYVEAFLRDSISGELLID